MVSSQCGDMGGSSDYAYIQTGIHRRTTKSIRDILVATQPHIRYIVALDCFHKSTQLHTRLMYIDAFYCFQRYHICRVFTPSGCTHVWSDAQHCVAQQVHIVISALSFVGINGRPMLIVGSLPAGSYNSCATKFNSTELSRFKVGLTFPGLDFGN